MDNTEKDPIKSILQECEENPGKKFTCFQEGMNSTVWAIEFQIGNSG